MFWKGSASGRLEASQQADSSQGVTLRQIGCVFCRFGLKIKSRIVNSKH